MSRSVEELAMVLAMSSFNRRIVQLPPSTGRRGRNLPESMALAPYLRVLCTCADDQCGDLHVTTATSKGVCSRR